MAKKKASSAAKSSTGKKAGPSRKSTHKRARTPKAAKTATRTVKARTGARKSAAKTSGNQGLFVRESGPRGWLLPILESAYTKLVPRGTATRAPARAATRARGARGGAAPARSAFRSRLQPGQDESVLEPVSNQVWSDCLLAYKKRKAAAVQRVARSAAVAVGGPPAAAVPGQKNWSFLGPSVVLEGQAKGLPPIGGRVSGLAIAPGDAVVYAASANGGVFRSNDSGMTWTPLMDGLDLQPTDFASTSLACGAIAIDRNDPRRVYVGTGEGDTNAIFANRVVNALPAYRGVGPIRSDDGGANWISEPTATGSPTLAGKAFFALAVDPADRENVVGATSDGLYQRVVRSGGAVEWVQRRQKVHSSVVVTSSAGGTRFFAAEWGVGVFHSADGTSWTKLDNGFPTLQVGRIALAVQFNNDDLVYALVANTQGALLGVYRLDGIGSAWREVSNPPDVLPVDSNGSSQGDYDLAIAVDPADADLIYLGGSYYNNPAFWPASIWRCRVRRSGSTYDMAAADSIGERVHADVHVLAFSPGDPNSLWACCDGGIFLNQNPRNSDHFDARNNGLACLCPNFFAQHPTDPSRLFCGFQDNGTARTSGGPIWKHVNGGDGGYCLINWNDPKQVIVFANGTVYRATDGGDSHTSWSSKSFPWMMMTEPISGPPYNPADPAEANVAALAAGNQVFISANFGRTWPATPLMVPTRGGIFSMDFFSGARFYVGTTQGEVFRLDRKPGDSWTTKRIDSATAGPLGLQGLVSDIAIDWSDSSGDSIYVAFGGMGDYRHVWHFDGTRWEPRSGPAGDNQPNLLDVEHNAIIVDRQAPANVYVGADIGVWVSTDSGRTWNPLANGLPEAPVFDLQIHPTRRLIRASTHGRGLYEYVLSP